LLLVLTLCNGCRTAGRSDSGSITGRLAAINNNLFARPDSNTALRAGSVAAIDGSDLANSPSDSSGNLPDQVRQVAFQEDQSEAAVQADQDPSLDGTAQNSRDEFFEGSEAPNRQVAGGTLALNAVLQSVRDCYPEIDIALAEIRSADGKVLASSGAFDTLFSAHSISQPLGFYQTYRNGAQLTRPLYGGGEVYGGYRIGDGNFEPWFGERETNEAGELKAGFSLPLLKDRVIDKRRADLLSADADRGQLKANIEARLLVYQRMATQAYWDWVAFGRAVQIQQQILALAEQRVEQIEERVRLGDLAKRARIDNNRFIAKREADLIKARRMFEKAAIKLSLFYRDADCAPVIADAEFLPTMFPDSMRIDDEIREADIVQAIAVRPELAELMAARRSVCFDLQYANNLTLPKLDVKGFAGQDLGGETSSKGDKTPFELQMGVFAEVPLQRREGLGKIEVAQGKLSQIDAKARFLTDKIRIEVQDAASAVNAAYDLIEQSSENLRLTNQSLELGRLAFEEGDIDLIDLNIYETAVADAELQLLDARFKYVFYLAAYRIAISANAFAQ